MIWSEAVPADLIVNAKYLRCAIILHNGKQGKCLKRMTVLLQRWLKWAIQQAKKHTKY